MNRNLLFCLLAVFLFAGMLQTAYAQPVAPPAGISYQAVARNPNGTVLANTTLSSVRISILSSINPIALAYEEVHNGVTTNGFGLFTLIIGGGTPTTNGAFNNLSAIGWGTSEHFAKIEVDQGQGYIDMGTVKLWSVPYALFAGNATNPGPTGPQGPQGPAGANGANGLVGPTGPQGIQGPQGVTGSGGVGPQGPAGANGATGPAGPQGVAGPQGPAGANGATGSAGPQGVAGPQGPAGANGAQGPQGVAGPQGPAGPAGADGAVGPQGVAGPQGPAGPAGADGAVGPQGPAGADGAVGPQGPAGIDGAVGPQGPAGADGAVGPQGPAGADGAVGPQGPAGADGAVGPQGPAGIDGAVGPQGPAGIDGAVGPQGPQGPAGANGVDGAQGPTGDVGATGPTGSIGSAATLSYTNDLAQSIPPGTDTPVNWNNFDAANSNGITGVTYDGISKFTNTSGEKLILNVTAYITWAFGPTTGTGRYAFAAKNGSVVTDRYGITSFGGPETDHPSSSVDFNIVLEDGEYFEIFAWQNELTDIEINSQIAFPGSRITIANLSGAQGPAGVDGAVGPQGPAGANGINGIDGAVGPQGPAGADGAVGPQGPAGVDGINGLDGAVGPTGPAGADGPQGPAGADGAVGPQGPAGADGLNGIDGAVGPQGPAGADGAVGPQGPAGSDGAQGPAGPQGPAGADGAVGPQGPAGPAGVDGVDGAVGPTGPAGPTGTVGNAWDLLGNTATDPAINYVGTTDANDFVVGVNATPQARFYQGGNTEFGEIDGSSSATVRATGGNVNVDPSFGFYNFAGGDLFNINENANGQLNFIANDDSPSGSDQVMLMDDETYNVGIGTAVDSTPLARLHVVENGNIGNLNTGLFQSAVEDGSSRILRSEYIGVTPLQEDIIAVSGSSLTADFYGIGGFFEGGYIGVEGYVTPQDDETYYGAYHTAFDFLSNGTLLATTYGNYNFVGNSGDVYGTFNAINNLSSTGSGNSYGVFNGLPDAFGPSVSPDGVNNYGTFNAINGGIGAENAGTYTLLTGGDNSFNYGSYSELFGGTGSANFGSYSIVQGNGGTPTSVNIGTYGEAISGVNSDISIGGYFESGDGPIGSISQVIGGQGTILGNYELNNLIPASAGAIGLTTPTAGGLFTYGVYGVGGSQTSFGNIGVFGYADLNPNTNYGVYGIASSPVGALSNVAVYGETVDNNAFFNYAGQFAGDVDITGNLSKSGGTFKIDHPLDPANKYLIHSFVESPDMMNVYNGNIVTDATGTAVVSLPTYFEAENKDFKYQLTVIGDFAQAIVFEKVSNNQFVIKTSKPNIEVSWQVTGVRQDAWANDHRVVVEKEKEAPVKGYYLYPQGFGFGKEKGFGAVLKPQGTATGSTTLGTFNSSIKAAVTQTQQTVKTNLANAKAKAEAEKIAHPTTKAPEKGTFTTKPVVKIEDVKKQAPASTTAPATNVKKPATNKKAGNR